MKKLITALVLTAFMTGAAFASSCPTHVKKIDEALTTATVSDEVKAQAKALRDQGEALHAEGKHDESMAALAEAEKLLGIAQ